MSVTECGYWVYLFSLIEFRIYSYGLLCVLTSGPVLRCRGVWRGVRDKANGSAARRRDRTSTRAPLCVSSRDSNTRAKDP